MNDKNVNKLIEDYLTQVGKCFRGSELEKKELLDHLESYIHDAAAEKSQGLKPDTATVKAVIDQMDLPESYGQPLPEKNRQYKSTEGKRGLIISIVSLTIIAILWITISIIVSCYTKNRGLTIAPAYFLFILCQIIAIIFGIIDWKKTLGKASVFVPSGLILLSILLIS